MLFMITVCFCLFSYNDTFWSVFLLHHSNLPIIKFLFFIFALNVDMLLHLVIFHINFDVSYEFPPILLIFRSLSTYKGNCIWGITGRSINYFFIAPSLWEKFHSAVSWNVADGNYFQKQFSLIPSFLHSFFHSFKQQVQTNRAKPVKTK